MLKMLVVSLGLLLALPAAAVAGEIEGKIQGVDAAGMHFVLEDGTRLWVGEQYLIEELTPGAKVKAAYEIVDGKNTVTDLDRRTDSWGVDQDQATPHETTDFGSTFYVPQ